MEKIDSDFGIKLNNIPIINLRNEFNTYYNQFTDEVFRSQFSNCRKPIDTPYLTWHGIPETLLTIILQRSVLGIESYVVGAVYNVLGSLGQLNQNNIKYLRNPFSLKGSGTADNFYNRLPSLASEKHRLKLYRSDLWNRTKKFYSEVRNPIFHGYELKTETIDCFPDIYRFLDNIYEWIDSWFNIEKLLPGAGVLAKRQ